MTETLAPAETAEEWLARFDALPPAERLATASYLASLIGHRQEMTSLTTEVGSLRIRMRDLDARADELTARARELEASHAQTAHDAAIRGYEEAVRLVGEHNPDLAAWLHALNPCEPFTPAQRADHDYFEQTGDDNL